jgi:hypothetical protein
MNMLSLFPSNQVLWRKSYDKERKKFINLIVTCLNNLQYSGKQPTILNVEDDPAG